MLVALQVVNRLQRDPISIVVSFLAFLAASSSGRGLNFECSVALFHVGRASSHGLRRKEAKKELSRAPVVLSLGKETC